MSKNSTSKFMSSCCKQQRVLEEDIKNIELFQETLRHYIQLALLARGYSLNKGGRGKTGTSLNFPLALHYKLNGFSVEEAVEHFISNYTEVVL